jgi:HAD superfamily hydrolase (TIGR01509 family)
LQRRISCEAVSEILGGQKTAPQDDNLDNWLKALIDKTFIEERKMSIKALIFDFDGLILETETPIFQSWQELYHAYGCEIPMETWAKIIGAAEYDFDPFDELERQLGRSVDRQAEAPVRRQRELDLILSQPVLPGVRETLQAAHRRGLPCAVASSSSCDWVEGHLKRLGMYDDFVFIKTIEDVARSKPAPDLFLAALNDLQVHPQEAIVFEDSPNGILAAKRAGIFCVTVPNGLTAGLSLDLADMRLNSLADLPLDELLESVNNHNHQSSPQTRGGAKRLSS